jgi:glycosyl transferase family 25
MTPLIYVINLDRDNERMGSIVANLRSLGLDHVRVPAVMGKDVPGWESLVDRRAYARRNRNDMPRAGEVGCYLSHLKALETFLRTDASWCVILEDDVEVLPGCPAVLGELGKRDDWDLAKLFCFHSGMPVRKRRLLGDHHLVVHLTRTTSSAAYAVNRKAAERMLATMLPITEQVDHAMDRPWDTGLRVRGVRPHSVSLAPVASVSSIGYDDKSSRKLPFDKALCLAASRMGKEIRRFLNGLKESLCS